MSAVLVVGQGAVGRALTAGLSALKVGEVVSIGARPTRRDLSVYRLADAGSAVIYAGGPAGEAACYDDPETAFAMHYSAVMKWVHWATPAMHEHVRHMAPRRLILISTAVTTGFYGAVKQLAVDHARDAALTNPSGDATLALRCGQIIGPEMPVAGTGVVATWVRQAVRGEKLVVHNPGDWLNVTLCSELIDRIATWLKTPITVPWEEERVCLPDPIPLPALARVCGLTARIASGATDDPAAHIVDGSKARVPFEVFVAVQGMAENALRASVPEAR